MVSDSGRLNIQRYQGDAGGFDQLAPRYEELVESNPLHAYMRSRSLAWLDGNLRPGMRVLEVGCGVGIEAVYVARRGIQVVASDISPAMVELARERVRTSGLEHLVEVIQCASGELSAALAGAKFDAAYTSFGPLNCEPDLAAAIREIAILLGPGAPLLMSVVSRPCLSELLVSSARLRFRKAFRRFQERVLVDIYGTGRVWFRAYSESELRRALHPWFVVGRIEGWLVVLPPPYLAGEWNRLRPIHRPLEFLDRRAARTWPFRGWGDHLHVSARRRVS